MRCTSTWGGHVDYDLESLLLDRVLRDDGARDGRNAEDVNAGRAGSRRVAIIRAVAGDLIADDDVVVQKLARRMAVERHARLAIVHDLVVMITLPETFDEVRA